MITLMFLNFILSTINAFLVNHFSNFIQPLTAMGQYLHSFTIPQTVLDIYSLVVYFLPISTIAVLIGFTILLVTAKLIFTIVKLPFSIFNGN